MLDDELEAEGQAPKALPKFKPLRKIKDKEASSIPGESLFKMLKAEGLPSKEVLKTIAATGLRVGGQVGGQILGGTAGALGGAAATPEALGAGGIPGAAYGAEVGGAAGGGIGELLAQQIEPNPNYPVGHRPVNWGRTGVSAAIGAIPASRLISVGKPLVSAAKGALLGYGGVAGNKAASGKSWEESLNPSKWDTSEILGGPVFGGATGGALSALHGYLSSPAKATTTPTEPSIPDNVEIQTTAQPGGQVLGHKGKGSVSTPTSPKIIKFKSTDIPIKPEGDTYTTDEQLQNDLQRHTKEMENQQLKGNQRLPWAEDPQLEPWTTTVQEDLAKKQLAAKKISNATRQENAVEAFLNREDVTPSEKSATQVWKGERNGAPVTMKRSWGVEDPEADPNRDLAGSTYADLKSAKEAVAAHANPKQWKIGVDPNNGTAIVNEVTPPPVDETGKPIVSEADAKFHGKRYSSRAAAVTTAKTVGGYVKDVGPNAFEVRLAALDEPNTGDPLAGTPVKSAEPTPIQDWANGGEAPKSTPSSNLAESASTQELPEVDNSTAAKAKRAGLTPEEFNRYMDLQRGPNMPRRTPTEDLEVNSLQSRINNAPSRETHVPESNPLDEAVEDLRLKPGEPDTLEGAGKNYGKPFGYDTSVSSAIPASEPLPADYVANGKNGAKIVNKIVQDKMKTPEHQEFLQGLKDQVKKALGEKGFAKLGVLPHIASGLGGVAIGATRDKQHPLRGALVGGAMGATIPAVINGASKINWRNVVDKLPDYQRNGYLMDLNSAGANIIGAPHGLGATTAIELMLQGDPRGLALLKQLPSITPRMKVTIAEAANSLQNNPMNVGESLPLSRAGSLIEKGMSLPATYTTAGHMALRDAGIDAGLPHAEATEMALGNEPIRGTSNDPVSQQIRVFGQGLQSLKSPIKVGDNKFKSWIANMAVPFSRTGSNVLAATPSRVPGVGALMKLSGLSTETGKAIAAQQGLGTAISVASYQLGKNIDPANASMVRKWVRNTAGRYGVVAVGAFEAGQVARLGGSGAQQLGTGITKGPIEGLPMPTKEPAQDWGNFLAQLSEGNLTVPRSMIPVGIQKELKLLDADIPYASNPGKPSDPFKQSFDPAKAFKPLRKKK